MGKIELELKKNNKKISLKTNILFINYKLFRQLFKSIVNLKKLHWDQNIVLRKRLEF